jgi:hypothetical protein
VSERLTAGSPPKPPPAAVSAASAEEEARPAVSGAVPGTPARTPATASGPPGGAPPGTIQVLVPGADGSVSEVAEAPASETNAAPSPYWVEGRDMYTDETNMYGRGWVRNDSTSAVTAVPVWVLWFDTNLNVIASTRAVIGLTGGLRPGEARSFGLTTAADPRIASYRYWVQPQP